MNYPPKLWRLHLNFSSCLSLGYTTKYHRQGLKRTFISPSAGSLRWESHHGWVLLRALLLASKHLSAHCALNTVERAFSSTPLSVRTLISLQGSTFMTSSKANYPPKAPLPRIATLGIKAAKFELGGQGHKHSVHSSASSSILCTATNEPTMEWDAGPARRDIVMNSVRQDNQAKLDYPRSSSTTSRMIYTWWKPMEWEFKTNITNIQNRQILR